MFAYDRQVATDPQNQAYYYECLADLANGRRSEELDMKKVMEESKGVVSRKDAMLSVRRFNLEPERLAAYSDEYIINQFRARVANVGSYEVPELREHLRKIGVYRQSQEIINAASDSMCLHSSSLSFEEVADVCKSSKHMSKLCLGWAQKLAMETIKSLLWQD